MKDKEHATVLYVIVLTLVITPNKGETKAKYTDRKPLLAARCNVTPGNENIKQKIRGCQAKGGRGGRRRASMEGKLHHNT